MGFLKILQLNGIFNIILIQKKGYVLRTFFYFCTSNNTPIQMKKNLVLFTLFVLPIVAYLFFASGVNSFIKLPTITKSIPEINGWKTSDGKEIKFANKITILGFTGTNLEDKKGNFFNLHQKIYDRYGKFKDFQIVFLAPIGTEKQVQVMIDKLKTISKIANWHYVFAPQNEINAFYSKLKLKGTLDSYSGTQFVYIVDKARNLRGRKGESKKDNDLYREGYNTTLVSELHNQMTDDVKIILAEYRLALKQNNAYKRK